jgi:D-inositol-3-phosphate glycosyltransferase
MPNPDSTLTVAKGADLPKQPGAQAKGNLEIALLTGCQDKSYAQGLAVALAAKGVRADVIGNDWVDCPEYHATPNLNFLNFGGIQQGQAGFLAKLLQILKFYARLLRYVSGAKPKIIHILWNNKLEYFDRTIFMFYLKLLGKRVVFTAHNVNKAKRDSEDSLLNRLTLRCQYRLADCTFAHTEKMKSEIMKEFGVKGSALAIIPFGVYNVLPDTDLTPREAKKKLGIGTDERTILFFGRIVPYKGLEYLLAALDKAYARNQNYRLIIAGEPMKGYEQYMADMLQTIEHAPYRDRVIQKLVFIRDEETELYFKAADALALPYKDIFQSGVLFVGFTYGLPVIGADVGSFRDDIIEGKTGYVFKPGDADDLANAIEKYFESDLYKGLEHNRKEIRDYVTARHSWDEVGDITRRVYEELLKRSS